MTATEFINHIDKGSRDASGKLYTPSVKWAVWYKLDYSPHIIDAPWNSSGGCRTKAEAMQVLSSLLEKFKGRCTAIVVNRRQDGCRIAAQANG